MEIGSPVIRFRKRYFTRTSLDRADVVMVFGPSNSRELIMEWKGVRWGYMYGSIHTGETHSVFLNDLYRAVNKKRAANSRNANREAKRAIIDEP